MDPLIEAEEIIAAEGRRAQYDPLLQMRYHWRRPSSLGGLVRWWALLPDAERERLLLLCAQLTGLVVAVLLERWAGGGD